MSDSKQSRKINRFNRFFAKFIAKLRKWLNKIGSPIRINRRFVRQLLGALRGQRQTVGRTAGFVLPTVTLVTLVVTLLVVTTVARSSDRARTASNARSEQVFKSAATPIVDRARAKIEALINDSKLPRATPSEQILDSVITNDSGKYTFPDETRLQLVYDFLKASIPVASSGVTPPPTIGADTKIGTSDSKIENKEYVSTAWKFPVDTDNNGKFDSYGLYSILFRARPQSVVNRPIVPIESRSLPMDETTLSGSCVSTGEVKNIVEDGGWTKSSDNKIKKSFFIYAVTVPIQDELSFPADAAQKALFETYKGISSISAVELQQDRARSPLNNNAVFFEGDLELVKTAPFRLNGRIYTAGSLMVGANDDSPITFYQVSSSGGKLDGTATNDANLFGSCYYSKANSEIVVAGSVVEGDAVNNDVDALSKESSDTNNEGVSVHLFQGVGIPPTTVAGGIKKITKAVQSVDSSTTGNKSSDLALNDFAYNRRISALVDAAVNRTNLTVTFPVTASFGTANLSYSGSLKDPLDVQKDIVKRVQEEALSSQAELAATRRTALSVYFGERTRKVSFREVGFGVIEDFSTLTLLTPIPVNNSVPDLAPPVNWMFPVFTAGFGTALNYATPTGFTGKGGFLDAVQGFTLLKSGSRLGLEASDPETVAVANETLLGDRVLVGNNFPVRWLNYSTVSNQLEFVSSEKNNLISETSGAVVWNNPATGATDRYRNTRAVGLSNLGVTDRGGFWEISAALNPAIADPFTPSVTTPDASPTVGGLRVVTNAGIYSRRPEDTFLPRFRTGKVDDTNTPNSDESSIPLWNGEPKDNPITSSIDESKFAVANNENRSFVVWPDSMPMTGSNGDPRKGDLQMRASAIYHYKYSAYNAIANASKTALVAADYQAPIACISSYYDPSTPATAKNFSTAPWNSGNNGRSNNGLVYAVGKTAASVSLSGVTYDANTGIFAVGNADADAARDPKSTVSSGKKLAYQANLIFPNGRFANEPLREVLKKIISSSSANGLSARLTLPQQSTLDSNLCALQILNSPLAFATASPPVPVTGVQVPHGAFREGAFLDGREVKSLNRNESLLEGANGNNARGTTSDDNGLAKVAKNRGDLYDLEIEQRQPLEIRSTDIDMDRLRGSTVTGSNNSGVAGVATDYLLPYSGLIYATREDALRDLSYYNKDTSGNPISTLDTDRDNLSSTDFLLDPTRRPSSIRLVNGYRLWRSSLNVENLGNVDGKGTTAAVSRTDYTKTTFPWTELTKGEKGLTLVSNVPVYIKAQYDPAAPIDTARVPSFNKHTQQEFTLALNETISNPPTETEIGAIWNNFYKRHANNGKDDKLNPNFACRPLQVANCDEGDQWRAATVIADTVSVLSANFRDGYRTDGDYDLRNNANTSTSVNWQSQLNPTLPDVFDGTKREPRKDSRYVLDRRRNGFFNNNFATSATWLNLRNSDGTAVPSSIVWPGAPDADTPDNGNLASYNANGVTPLQRRVRVSEYSMEICRKLPVSECTFSDWVGLGAGTTTLPDFSTTGLVSTPLGAPRYIADADTRFARRLSFLRFDDIYKDGNKQLILTGRCDNASSWPIQIGVANGNDPATGYTYPHVLGDRTTPFEINNNTSYGTVPCPEALVTVEISSETQLGQNTLPSVTWGTTGNDLGVIAASPINSTGSVTNSEEDVGYAANNSTGTTNKSIQRGRIRINSPNDPCNITPTPTEVVFTNNDDTAVVTAATCAPDGSGGGIRDNSSISHPVFASLYRSKIAPFSIITPPAAAYPFNRPSGYFRAFDPPSNTTATNTTGTIITGTEGGRYVWGDDTNGNGILGDTVSGLTDRTDIFPNIPPRSGGFGELPMLPGDFTKSIADTVDSNQMKKSRPNEEDRTLWYRTAPDNNYIGEADNVTYNANRNLFINNLSFPSIGSGRDSSFRANLNAASPLVLPNTPCINVTDGTVDDRCITKSYKFGENATYTVGSTPVVETAGTTLLNLNLPYNPHFPSDNTSAVNGASTTEPASSFVVCDATGKTHNYQAIERPSLKRGDISGLIYPVATPATYVRCAQTANSAGEAIRNFVGTITTTDTTTGNGTKAVTTTSVTGGTGLLSLSLFPPLLGQTSTTFKGLNPDITKKNDGVTTKDLGTDVSPNTNNIDVTLRAVNTYANNRVHVFNVNNLGVLDGGTRNLTGSITFRANCVTVDPTTGADTSSTCTPTSVRRGSSPVFIMRGDFTENINFKGLKVKLDGVDPNNIFWVSSRIQSRLEIKTKTSSGNFLLTSGDGKDPRIAVGKSLSFSSKQTSVPLPLLPNVIYYVLYNNGDNNNGGSSVFGISATPPPAGVNCGANNRPATCPAEITNIGGSADFALSADPSFIFEGSVNNPNILVGNFLGTTRPVGTTMLNEDNTSVFAVKNKYSSFRGVRFLGLWTDPSLLNDETLFAAMTKVDEPEVLPVLQLNVPNSTDNVTDDIAQPNLGSSSGINGRPTSGTGQWTIRPTKTEVNVYIVGGNSPSRNGVGYTTSSTIYTSSSPSLGVTIDKDLLASGGTGTGETGGGLANFVRFLENWDDVPIKIAGGFIQNTKSRFATAPWASTAPLSSGVSDTRTLFMNPVQPSIRTTNGRIMSGYNLQYMSITANQIPYYAPPIRLWGYDVGLLTQQPDRFAERFASPIAGVNEFFREVSGDDLWVETLLCALEPTVVDTSNKAGAAPADYLRRALRGSDLRSNCNNKPTYGGAVTAPNYTIPSTVYQ